MRTLQRYKTTRPATKDNHLILPLCDWHGRAGDESIGTRGFNREFRDVVFEDVAFDNNSSVTPH